MEESKFRGATYLESLKVEVKCDEELEETQGSCPEVHMRGFQSKEEELTIYVTGSFLIRQLIETWEPDLLDLVRNNIEDLLLTFKKRPNQF